MAKSYIHADISSARFGGKSSDYLAIHEFMDSSKLAIPDNRHRALTHTTWFIEVVLKRVFGESIKNSDGKIVSVQDIGEQHCLDDFGHKFIPTAQDYLEEMEIFPWMSNLDGLPRSAKKISSKSLLFGVPNVYPLAIEPSLDRAVLWPVPQSIFDTEMCIIGKDKSFFEHPLNSNVGHMPIKSDSETNLNQSGMLDYPREFEVRSVALIFEGIAPGDINSDQIRLVLSMNGEESIFKFKEFPSCDYGLVKRLLSVKTPYHGIAHARSNPLPDSMVLPIKLTNRRINPGVAFKATIDWGDFYSGICTRAVNATVALCGSMWLPL